MEDNKYIKKLLEQAKQYEIENVVNPNFHLLYSPFEGSPKKHPIDENVLILLSSEQLDKKTFYEFSLNSIGNIEDLGTVSDNNGKSSYLVKVWVKNGTTAIKSQPFIVA